MIDLMMRLDILLLLSAVAFITYLTRTGGHLLLSGFSRIPPRLEAALEAVPAAVITAIVIPPALTGGPAELVAIIVAGLATLRFSALPVLLIGLATLIALRGIGL